MVPRAHHLCFIHCLFRQCYMTSTASDLRGFNDQFVFSDKTQMVEPSDHATNSQVSKIS